jgi:hypothetical protein
MKMYGRVKVWLHHSEHQSEIKVSDQLHAPAVLPLVPSLNDV